MTQMTGSKVHVSKYIAAEDCKQGSVLAEREWDENVASQSVFGRGLFLFEEFQLCFDFQLLHPSGPQLALISPAMYPKHQAVI